MFELLHVGCGDQISAGRLAPRLKAKGRARWPALYILLSIIAAVLFFDLRRRPFVYGLFEFAVGLVGLMLLSIRRLRTS